MANKSLAIAILLLRILTLVFLLVSLIILATDTFVDDSDDSGDTFEDYSDDSGDTFEDYSGDKTTFRDFYAYRYVLSVDAIGGAYTLVQILLSVISLITQTYFASRLHTWLHQFFDMVFALFFATGAGAGFGLTVDAKKQLHLLIELAPRLNKYFNLVYVSSALLLTATVTMAAIILCSVHVLARK